MSMSDPIADLITRIRNGADAKKKFIDVPWSKLKENLVKILEESGFIDSHKIKMDQTRGTLRIFLKYTSGRQSAIQGIKRVSKPGCRKYVTSDQIPYFYGGFGEPVLSTSKGIMTGNAARKSKTGGELLFLVW